MNEVNEFVSKYALWSIAADLCSGLALTDVLGGFGVFLAYRQPAFLDRSGGPRPPVARIPFSGGKYYLDKNLLHSLHNILQRMLILLGERREQEIWKAMFSNTNNSIPSQDIDIVFPSFV